MPFGRLVNEADTRLREWLDTAAHKPGTRLPSERALASQLGLQHYALNRAMGRLIAEGRVEREGYRLFVSNGTPQSASLTCHLVVAQRSIHIPSYKRVAKEMGIKLVVQLWQSNEEALMLLTRLVHRDTQAVLFDPPYAAAASSWTPIAEKLIRNGIPIACVGQSAAHAYSVVSDSHHDVETAIDHLFGLGHRELGFVTDAPVNRTAAETVNAWEAVCRGLRLGSSVGRVHLQGSARPREEVPVICDLLAGPWSGITALVLYSGLEYNVQLIQERLVRRGHQIPRDLSIVFVGGAKSPATATLPVTSVAHDMPLVLETAFHLIQRAVRKKRTLGILPPACCIRVQSQFTQRNSTQPPASLPAGHHIAVTPRANTPERTHLTPEDCEACLRKAYPLAARASLSEKPRFAPLDLAALVNRPLNFRRGWLGDLPLKQFPPGIHEIHGVPFNILGGPRRTDCGAIVFHSAVNITGKSRPLPDRVVIPINAKARSIYVLHGCGYAKFLNPFAKYRFMARRSCIEEVPLVTFGQPPPDYDPALQSPDAPKPNIQDWWPDFAHTDFPHARMAPLIESDEGTHLSRHVYLYTLEWINPEPDKLVNSLEISVDSTLSTTLGVLAVTALKP